VSQAPTKLRALHVGDALQGVSDIKVLHVEDEPDFADLVSLYLERENDSIEVLTEHRADDGLSRLNKTDLDCIVSDYQMPGMNGLEFLDTLREDYPDLPFILFTGKGSEEVASEAISMGVTDYLQKESGTDQYTVLANRITNAVDYYRSQQALEASEIRLSLLVDHSPLGVIEWNTEFNIVRTNSTAEEILGYPESELEGKSWEDIIPEHEHGKVQNVIDQLSQDSGGYHSINENLQKDGQTITCEWHNRLATDDSGEVVTVFTQFQDVTEREEYERQLETLIENLPGMVYQCLNEPGWPMMLVEGECEELTGYPASALENDEIHYGSDIIHPDDREQVWEDVQEALDHGEPFELNYRIIRRDDTVTQVWERGQGIRSPDGELEALEGFITAQTPED
jgi:PAS domain S-box-containing protein